ncbi:uncharacterized protein [Dendrobates tinctorius]|uniref:uncharacterized protein isoform X2 n=1 Tax=Dendrobates tinctorius TaxID=92724 RepID=UPI003CC953C6
MCSNVLVFSFARMSSGSEYSPAAEELADAERETSASDQPSEGEQPEQRTQSTVGRRRTVPQQDEDVYLDNEQLMSLVQERVPLWDSRDQQYKDIVVTRRLWNEVAAALMEGWDSASATVKKAFMNKVRKRWCSMKDRFNTDVRAEGQVRSGSSARTRTKYRYHRALEFLRPAERFLFFFWLINPNLFSTADPSC